ncbi:MAG TPA: hypothetical protein PLZ45_14975 [Ferruginibacter sp.]|nr:hypothetical protein [Ferruginibacter sp.]
MNPLITVLDIFEGIACITGFVYWKRVRNSYWRWFPFYLAAIVINEVTGVYLLHVKRNLSLNTALYSYWGIPLQFFFFFWLFHRYFKEAGIKTKWPPLAAAIYGICWLSDIFSWPDLYYLSQVKLYFDSFSYTIGNIGLLVLLLIFFLRFSKSDEVLHYRSSRMFWVCLGLLIFYVGSMPFYGIRTTLYYQYPDIFYPYWNIQFIMGCLMYLFFSISFIWGKAK